jgi:hypothetical protein
VRTLDHLEDTEGNERDGGEMKLWNPRVAVLRLYSASAFRHLPVTACLRPRLWDYSQAHAAPNDSQLETDVASTVSRLGLFTTASPAS